MEMNERRTIEKAQNILIWGEKTAFYSILEIVFMCRKSRLIFVQLSLYRQSSERDTHLLNWRVFGVRE